MWRCAHLEIGDSAMWREWEVRQSIVSQVVPDFVPDVGFAVTYRISIEC